MEFISKINTADDSIEVCTPSVRGSASPAKAQGVQKRGKSSRCVCFICKESIEAGAKTYRNERFNPSCSAAVRSHRRLLGSNTELLASDHDHTRSASPLVPFVCPNSLSGQRHFPSLHSVSVFQPCSLSGGMTCSPHDAGRAATCKITKTYLCSGPRVCSPLMLIGNTHTRFARGMPARSTCPPTAQDASTQCPELLAEQLTEGAVVAHPSPQCALQDHGSQDDPQPRNSPSPADIPLPANPQFTVCVT